jgi:hypothetical protein
MANRQIYQLDTKSLDLTDVIPVQDEYGNNEMGKTSLSDLQNVVLKQTVETITVEGVDAGTTAVLIYGINVVTASTIGDFCARLPLTPLKGKSVIVVNTSNIPVRIFPSVDGGKINGVVDGYFDVPADSLPYTFICYENPNPGYWGTTSIPSSNINTLTYPEVTVSHTQGGGDSYYVGVDTMTISSLGAGIDINGNLTLTPPSTYWKSENMVAIATKVRVYTNILSSDFNNYSDNITVGINGAHKTAVNGTTSGSRGSYFIEKYCVYNPATYDYCNIVPTGSTLNSPVEIGDAGTYYIEFKTVNADLGLGGEFSRYYYTFNAYINSGCATKDYKFRFELDYV